MCRIGRPHRSKLLTVSILTMRWHQARPHAVLPGHRGPRARPVEARRCRRAACPGGHRAAGPHSGPEAAAVHHGAHGAEPLGEALCLRALGVVQIRQALFVLINSNTKVIAAIVCVAHYNVAACRFCCVAACRSVSVECIRDYSGWPLFCCV